MWPFRDTRLGEAPSGRLTDQQLQDRLFRYLSTGVDEVDDYSVYPKGRADLMQLRARSPQLFIDETRQECGNWPAWKSLLASRKLKSGYWFVHHTRQAFRRFQYGTTYCGMNDSANRPEKARVDCELNLASGTPDSQRVWGFAYWPLMSPQQMDMRKRKGLWTPEDERLWAARHGGPQPRWRSAPATYGDQYIYFKTNAAVEVFHSGESHFQIVFPLCTEYDIVTSEDVRERFGGRVWDALDYVDGQRSSSLSGLSRGSRFAFRK